MTTKFKSLRDTDPDAYEMIGSQITNRYLDGECYEFALALSEGLGWPMVGLISTFHGELTIRHVMLLTDKSMYFDARGQVASCELGEPFGLPPAQYSLQTHLTRADIEAVRPVNEHSIETARMLAEAYFFWLPWKDSLAKRTTKFMDELEELSRKHGIWIFGPLPTTWPVLSESDGEDEKGYTLAMNFTGMSVSFNRRLTNEE